MISEKISIFSLNSGKAFAGKVADYLHLSLTQHQEVDFEDGEHKIRPLESVRGKDVYVLQSLFSDEEMSVNDKLCRLLFFIGALKDAAANKVTAVIPYLCYSRKDRKTKSRDPVTSKYVAKMIESAGADHVVTLDVHNLQAFQNAYRCSTDHLEARKLFAGYFSNAIPGEDIVVLSPDAGGMKRADRFRNSLGKKLKKELPLIFMQKKRSNGIVSGSTFVGEVKGKTVIIMDDLISSGTTLARAATACMEAGAEKVMAAATHGVFNAKANESIRNPALERVVVTNSIYDLNIDPELLHGKVKVIDVSPLIAECIEKLHGRKPVISLIED